MKKNTEQWLCIFNNNLEKGLVHDGRGYKLFYDNGNGKSSVIYLQGITRTLSSRYWPNFMPVKATNVISKSSARNNKIITIGGKNGSHDSTTEVKIKKPGSWNAARIAGLVRGTEVHTQLKTYTQLMEFHKYGLNNHAHNTAALNNFNALHPRCSPCTEAILSNMRDWGWVPIRAAVPVFNPNISISKWATEIDLIAIDPLDNNKLILIELKTGYNTNFQRGSEQMKRNMELNNSPLNQAKVQLVASAMLFSEMYTSITSYAMYVIWCSSDGKSIQRFHISTDQYAHIHNNLAKNWMFEKPETNNSNKNSNHISKKRKFGNNAVSKVVYIDSSDEDSSSSDSDSGEYYESKSKKHKKY